MPGGETQKGSRSWVRFEARQDERRASSCIHTYPFDLRLFGRLRGVRCSGRVELNLDLHCSTSRGVSFVCAEGTLALGADEGNTHLRLMLDLYRARIGEENLVVRCWGALPHIGEIQVATYPAGASPGPA